MTLSCHWLQAPPGAGCLMSNSKHYASWKHTTVSKTQSPILIGDFSVVKTWCKSSYDQNRSGKVCWIHNSICFLQNGNQIPGLSFLTWICVCFWLQRVTTLTSSIAQSQSDTSPFLYLVPSFAGSSLPLVALLFLVQKISRSPWRQLKNTT